MRTKCKETEVNSKGSVFTCKKHNLYWLNTIMEEKIIKIKFGVRTVSKQARSFSFLYQAE